MPRLTVFLIGLLSILLLTDCANMRGPTGGPKDVSSPLVLESEPPNYSLHFDANRVILKFNEFLKVEDVATEVFISPPFQKTPEIKSRGKSVIITIDEELHDSTTYSVFFGNAIKDITEGNSLENYTYVFSTGDFIDSLTVVGEILDAFTLKPRKNVLVMLYEDNNDTIPFDSMAYLVKPSYLTRTSEEGFFVINNFKEGEYDVVALADNNMSATYDNAEEEVAFLDSLIMPQYLEPILRDTLVSDSLSADSIPNLPIEDFYTLFMFKEVDSTQRLLGAEMPRKRVLRFIFRYPAGDVNIEALTPVTENWMLSEWTNNMDTLRYYIMEEGLDTISLRISMDTTVFDTLSFSLDKKPVMPQRKKERVEAQKLKFAAPRKRPFPHHKDYILMTGYPVTEYDFSRFMLAEGEDTLQPMLSIYGESERMLKLDHDLKEDTEYILFYPDSVMTDLLGRSNDSTWFKFTTDAEDDYGIYKINIVNTSPYEQLLIQILSEKEKILREEIIQDKKTITWDYLKGGKYLLKAVGDINKNGFWDTGNFADRRQAEPVVFYPESIEVRADWTFDLDWIVRFE